MSRAFSWIGLAFVLLLLLVVWLFFVRSGPALAPVEARPLACNKGNAKEARGPGEVVVYYTEGCVSTTAEGAARIRDKSEQSFRQLADKGVDAFYYPVLVELGPSQTWEARSKRRAPGAIRIPSRSQDQEFFIASALASLWLSEKYPGLQNNRALAEGYAIYSLGNSLVPASRSGFVFYKKLFEDQSGLEQKLLLCRERQCSISQLL